MAHSSAFPESYTSVAATPQGAAYPEGGVKHHACSYTPRELRTSRFRLKGFEVLVGGDIRQV